MKKLIYIVLIVFAVVACEEIYTPDLDSAEDFLVVEAILISNDAFHDIYVYETVGFYNDSTGFPPVSGAKIYLVDENNFRFPFNEIYAGRYRLNYSFVEGENYSLNIELDGEYYESSIQRVPGVPEIDSVYAGYTSNATTAGVASSTDNVVKSKGFQLFVDMKDKDVLSYYRFGGKKILQYIDFYDTIMPMDPEPVSLPIYGWETFYPTGGFNVAGPPKFSTDRTVTMQPLEFFDQNYYNFMADTLAFSGWIYSIYQYGINEDTYNYYTDLNSQLETDGKIFDPVYVQAVGNIVCTSNPDVTILGNFEISSYNEERYFLSYKLNNNEIDTIKYIPYHYHIPEKGYIKDTPPEFWESRSKAYPND